MALLLSTTGTLDPVVINDLGARSFSHPTINLNLELEYQLWELVNSSDLSAALTAGYITLTFDGTNINSQQLGTISRGNMETFTYDIDANGVVDSASTAGNSLTLLGQNGSYYLNRANHTGTQTAATISDFNSAVSGVVMQTGGTAGYALNASTAGWAMNSANAYLFNNNAPSFYLDRTNHTGTQVAATISDFVSVTNGIIGAYGTSGWATNSAHSYTSDLSNLSNLSNDSSLLQGQNGAYYLSRANHTGTQVAATISDFVSVTQGVIGAYGTMGWATNAANAYQLNNQPASFYLNTNSSIDALSDVDTVTVAPINTDLLNYSTAGTGNWVPIHAKSIITRNTWLLSAGVNSNNATNRYCDWWGGAMNLSGYVVPVNATIIYISMATNGAQTWTAEVRKNGTNVAQLATTAASAKSTILNVNVNAGDIITLFVTGSSISHPTITVHFVER